MDWLERFAFNESELARDPRVTWLGLLGLWLSNSLGPCGGKLFSLPPACGSTLLSGCNERAFLGDPMLTFALSVDPVSECDPKKSRETKIGILTWLEDFPLHTGGLEWSCFRAHWGLAG